MTTFPETHQDLLDAQLATLATIGGDGYPQLTEVWFLYDDGELKLSLNDARLKTRNLLERPQCSLFVLDLEKPQRYLSIRGDARVEPDTDHALVEKVKEKYGADVRDHDRPGQSRMVVTIEPTHVYAVDMTAGQF